MANETKKYDGLPCMASPSLACSVWFHPLSEICLSLGVDDPSEVLFVTDLLPEAEAARLAKVRVALSVRPGNAPLPEVSPICFRWDDMN